LAADEAKPIEPLLVAETKALIILIHLSPPPLPRPSASLHTLQLPRQGGEGATPGL
jgi:hypothetical protein